MRVTQEKGRETTNAKHLIIWSEQFQLVWLTLNVKWKQRMKTITNGICVQVNGLAWRWADGGFEVYGVRNNKWFVYFINIKALRKFRFISFRLHELGVFLLIIFDAFVVVIWTEADTKPFCGCLWNGTCSSDDRDENGNKIGRSQQQQQQQ